MNAHALATPKFLRKTTLRPNEYNTHFRMLDDDIIAAVSSPEADRITPLMSKIYLRLIQAPIELREAERQLRFAGEEREGKWATAWEQLCRHLNVSSETANKALRWLHDQGIIGYSAFKNGVGIRIFLNRAAASIGCRQPRPGEKNLPRGLTSAGAPAASLGEAAFKDNLTVDREVEENSINRRTPAGVERTTTAAQPGYPNAAATDELVTRVVGALGPTVRAEARRAAAQEHERTREWLEQRGLPKAARVAQRESYNLLRQHGVIAATAAVRCADMGRSQSEPTVPHQLGEAEIKELAETCVALREVQGKEIAATLGEMSSGAGGFLLPADTRRVQAAVHVLLAGAVRREG